MQFMLIKVTIIDFIVLSLKKNEKPEMTPTLFLYKKVDTSLMCV